MERTAPVRGSRGEGGRGSGPPPPPGKWRHHRSPNAMEIPRSLCMRAWFVRSKLAASISKNMRSFEIHYRYLLYHILYLFCYMSHSVKNPANAICEKFKTQISMHDHASVIIAFDVLCQERLIAKLSVFKLFQYSTQAVWRNIKVWVSAGLKPQFFSG